MRSDPAFARLQATSASLPRYKMASPREAKLVGRASKWLIRAMKPYPVAIGSLGGGKLYLAVQVEASQVEKQQKIIDALQKPAKFRHVEIRAEVAIVSVRM